MKYCEKCRQAWEESVAKCPACRNSRLRPADGKDLALLTTADLYAAQKLCQALEEAGCPFETEDAHKGQSYFQFDGQSMPTDQKVFVPVADLPAAQELAAQTARLVQQERDGGQEEDPGPPGAKRLLAEVLSVAAFLLLIMVAVYGADAFAGWIKSLWGL